MGLCLHEVCFFFFSSRRRHTRYWRDWSSDVCSSDLRRRVDAEVVGEPGAGGGVGGEAERGAVRGAAGEIGRASCRERVEISEVAVSLKKKIRKVHKRQGARQEKVSVVDVLKHVLVRH